VIDCTLGLIETNAAGPVGFFGAASTGLGAGATGFAAGAAGLLVGLGAGREACVVDFATGLATGFTVALGAGVAAFLPEPLQEQVFWQQVSRQF